jgi:hypothetical protein
MTCEVCQQACYDLLDRRLCAKDEAEVLDHVAHCPSCRRFLEEEGERMRQWPLLLRDAAQDVAMPADAVERVAHALEVSRGRARGRPGAWRRNRFSQWSPRLSAFAAAVLILMCLGGTAWLVAGRLPKADREDETYQAAAEAEQVIRVLGQREVKELDIPAVLPGTVKLAEGEIVLRVQTGVELTVLGPAEMKIQDGMQVFLERGRLFVRVPQWAMGFTVRTRQLEVCDLGTVFGVSADEAGSDMFVFKGSVQVNETGEGASGTSSAADIGICEAGEGVVAKTGAALVAFAVDSADAQALFGEVKGCAALKNPARAWQVSREIAALWTAQTPPETGCAAQTAPGKAASAAAATSAGGGTRATGREGRAKAACSFLAAGAPAVTNALATDLYFSAGGSGPAAWDAAENWRVYQSAGGGFAGRLPSGADTVRVNAATLAAENGDALVITNGVNAACDSFASGFKDYPGTACLRLEGGTLTSRTSTVIGMNYPGLAVLESGELSCGTDLCIGGYGNPAGWGVVTNNGAAVTALRLHMGHEANTFGRLVHRGGSLDCLATDALSSLQVGFNGGVGEFEAAADFSANVMSLGQRGAASLPLGTGTVTVAEGATGTINGQMRVNNGALVLEGGTIRFQGAGNAAPHLVVRQDAEGQALIRGWGRLTGPDTGDALRMVNNGRIAADGKGVARDLDLSAVAAVGNDLHNGRNGTSGWYAVNRGRVLLPHTARSFSAAVPYCLGDLCAKPLPELVNSVGFAFSAPVRCAVRGALCATDRRDIPGGLPAHLRPVGVWSLGAYADNASRDKQPFSAVRLTFRYDHTRLKATDRLLRLFRYDGKAWVQVGTCLPGGHHRISTDAPLAPVASGDCNIGWFAVMAVERNGTLISVQ